MRREPQINQRAESFQGIQSTEKYQGIQSVRISKEQPKSVRFQE